MTTAGDPVPGLQQMQEPLADVGKSPGRREPPPVPGLGSYLVGGAGGADGTASAALRIGHDRVAEDIIGPRADPECRRTRP